MTRTVTADDWRASLSVDTGGWVPGDYLFVLQASTGEQNRVPLTVRGPSARGAVVIVNAVTTWNAYNLFGGYDLYAGRTAATAPARMRCPSTGRMPTARARRTSPATSYHSWRWLSGCTCRWIM